MKKKLLSGLLAAAMVLCLLPAGAAAASDAAQSVKIGNVTLNGTNPYYVNDATGGQGAVYSDEPTAWNAKLDNGTLYINGLNVSVEGPANSYKPATTNAALYADGNLTIELDGDSVITNTATSSYGNAYGIYCVGALTVKGDGALTVTGGAANGQTCFSCGIFAKDSITLEGGTLNGIGSTTVNGEYCSSFGIWSDNIIKVTGGTLTGKGGEVKGWEDLSYGIFAINNITLESGTLNGTGGTPNGTYCSSRGVYSKKGAIKVTGGTLTGIGSPAVISSGSTSYGVWADEGSIVVNGGTIIGTGGSGRTSVGVEGATISFNQRGGTIIGTGGDCGEAHSFGIYTPNNFTINAGCTVVGTGGTNTSGGGGSYGAYCGTAAGKGISVKSGGVLTLKGATQTLYPESIVSPEPPYKYRASASLDSIPTNLTPSTTAYEHKVENRFVQILPEKHPDPPTGITLDNDTPEVSYPVTATLTPQTALTIDSTITAAPRYQWYTSNTYSTTGGTAIAGATEASYRPAIDDLGKYLYVTANTYDYFDGVSACTSSAVKKAEVKFESVKANGSDSATTTALTLTFDRDIDGLSTEDIRLTGAAKGELTKVAGETGVYTLGISNITVADKEELTVTVSKEDHTVSPLDKSATVRVYVPAPPTYYGGSVPVHTVKNQAGTVWLTGAGLVHNDVLITDPLSASAAYNMMLFVEDETQVFGMYDISLKSGVTANGAPMTLKFAVGTQYAGQTFTLVHRKANGTAEYFTAVADANGNVSFGPLYELSPFALLKGDLTQAEISALATMEIPKTGEQATTAGYVMMALAIGALCGICVLRKKEKE